MKVGDYVRTKDYQNIRSRIGKIIRQDGKYYYLDIDEDTQMVWDKDTILTSSPYIIDLIEVGDLIRIEYYSLRYEERVTRLFEVTFKDKKYINLNNSKCDFMLIDGDFNKSDKELEPIIKSIVTKEQIENQEYEVK